MSKIALLDNSYDLFLGYSWSPVGGTQGIGGHLYECIEYYTILKKHLKVGIFVCTSEKLTLDAIKVAVNDKYDFTEQEVQELLSDIHFFDPPRILKGRNLLLVDGNFTKLKDVHLLFDNIMAFACFDRAFSEMHDITAFQDYRIYGSCRTHKHYVKKLLFDRYKKVETNVKDVNLVYIKNGPKNVDSQIYDQLESSYRGNFLVVTNVPIDASTLSNRFNVVYPPLKDLFQQFNTYIYTPVPKKFDCSPRFTAECAWYGKDVIYHNINYWDVDRGLYWRRHDIEHNFDSLILKDDDEIVDFVKNIIYD